ncbi:hypothetical protein LCGC14_1383750 [marine sediment metagenome]|uniref:PIN domain-containing protein n=1 Tax=marine sediment metagenome TaxID=412755 RepID=A0A0F9K1Y5_9ZZZZ
MTTFVFLDTNVLIHCKTFTEIEWKELFKESQKKEDIVIVVPYMVNKELDNSKKYDKKARNIQNKLKELKDVEFKEDITLNITIFPIKWSSLKSEWIEKLDENESDCKIIAEILVFKDNHPDDVIYFVTGDNTPYFQANALGINTIFWLDDQYKAIFEPSKVKTAKINKLTDLKIYFKNRENKYELPIQNDISLDDFVVDEFPDFPDLMKEEKRVIEGIESKKSHEMDEVMTIKEAEEKGLTVGDLIKSLGRPHLEKLFSAPLLLNLKSREQFKEEVLKYYEEIKEYRKYVEIELYLTNMGNRPFNNVNIELYTLLEKDFDLKSKEELEKPEKPKIDRTLFPFSSYSSILPMQHKEYNVKYSSPQKIEKEKNDIWVFGYSIKKIQHNDTLGLYPITIKFPEEFKMKKIQFICSFKHDEEGVTKEQKLTLDVSNLI